jgi:Domain of unknown function (DUF4232)
MTLTGTRMGASKAVVVAAVALASVAAGCTSTAHTPSAALRSTTTRRPSSFASTTNNSPNTTLAMATTTTSLRIQGSSVPPCVGSAIAVSASPLEAALGNVAVTLLFRNVSTTTCSLYGYPGVAGLDAGSRQVTQARRTQSGYFAILPTLDRPVTLPPGAAASALVDGGDNPLTGSTCPIYPAFLVTPPGAYTSTEVPIRSPGRTFKGFPGCTGLLVQPVVAGTKGGQP